MNTTVYLSHFMCVCVCVCVFALIYVWVLVHVYVIVWPCVCVCYAIADLLCVHYSCRPAVCSLVRLEIWPQSEEK